MSKVSRFYTESMGTFFVNSQFFESFFSENIQQLTLLHIFYLIASSDCSCFKGYHFYCYSDYHKQAALNPKGLLVTQQKRRLGK